MEEIQEKMKLLKHPRFSTEAKGQKAKLNTRKKFKQNKSPGEEY
jgi:hypothetical protein